MTTVHILHGDNELQREEALAAVIHAAGLAPDWHDLNTDVLTGPLTLAELRQACSTIPFLGDARIVIVREALSPAKGPAAKEIAAYLPDIPSTTTLIFCESKSVPPQNPILAQARKMDADIQMFTTPAAKELPGWVVKRTKMHQGKIDFAAAQMLAQNIGGNLRLLDQEICKLLLYSGENKTITVDDVQVMVPYIQSADVVFNMVDAIGQRDPRSAATYLHRLLEVGEHPLGIFGMVVRQFRLLIQVRWLVDHTVGEEDIAARLKLHPYVTKKVRAQVEHFTAEQLRAAYRLLTESDLAVKTGLLEAETALDLLIVQLTRL
ncbi:MAG TPA: DNA polymerase III subunit delta [Anaerolineae bacterium]|nr:DNA polymerase III subunit delta [Anaerolineae bacterium]HQH37693.1 DNA polymerase III subunit delta [Anaerolineae bacterium]